MINGLKTVFDRGVNYFTVPRSTSEDFSRRKSIFSGLLLGSIILTTVALAFTIYYAVIKNVLFSNPSPVILLATWLTFIALYLSNRVKFRNVLAIIFVSLYFLLGTFTAYKWGIMLAQGWLVYVFVIIMASILLGTTSGLVFTLIVSVSTLVLTYLVANGTTSPDTTWVKDPGEFDDAIIYVFSLMVIGVVSWLSNREIDQSLRRARTSEALLKKERDQLEVTVDQRTRELLKAERTEMRQLHHFAQLGRLATDLLHDLVTPLTSASLDLKQLNSAKRTQLVSRAVKSITSMERFIESARKQIQQQKELSLFRPAEEMRLAEEILASRVRKAGVTLQFFVDKKLEIFGNPTRFHKVIVNLLTNAIDACADKDGQRLVTASLGKVKKIVRLTVEDTGVGISPEDLAKIFTPFFTTKNSRQGIGIGLMVVKEIIEKDLGGVISVSSNPGKGTRIVIEVPLLEAKE